MVVMAVILVSVAVVVAAGSHLELISNLKLTTINIRQLYKVKRPYQAQERERGRKSSLRIQLTIARKRAANQLTTQLAPIGTNWSIWYKRGAAKE